WQLRRLNLPEHRRRTLERFLGTLCIDELHLGKYTLLLATDPLSDAIIGFALVRVNDQAHMRRFLLMLKHWGFLPSLVISDGSSHKEKAAFVFKRRYLVVKRQESLSAQERKELQQMFAYVPELRTLWRFSQQAYKLWDSQQSRKVARWRWTRLKNDPEYQQVPELKEVLGWLTEEKFTKTQAFLKQPTQKRLKTNNHVERANRRLRFDEKVRY